MFCGATCRNQLFLNFIPTGLVCCLHQSTTSLEGLGSSLGSSLGGSLGAPPPTVARPELPNLASPGYPRVVPGQRRLGLGKLSK